METNIKTIARAAKKEMGMNEAPNTILAGILAEVNRINNNLSTLITMIQAKDQEIAELKATISETKVEEKEVKAPVKAKATAKK